MACPLVTLGGHGNPATVVLACILVAVDGRQARLPEEVHGPEEVHAQEKP